ncbi:MAG: neutral/alkaline non-lysosomal ceramidase N-terminal domain-containing protein [Bacteroidales bacterium]|jgi:hypothetical protein|nr:neutral/alkaline non-lysosomal ceramidase N-terminal domain-containing protein [Bacteroidales bacterium]
MPDKPIKIYGLLFVSALFFTSKVFAETNISMLWKAGTAQVVITPGENLWMAGYAARNQPSEGKIHDLYAKALVLEDSYGSRSVLVTSDLLGFTADLSNRIRKELASLLDLTKAQIILNASHTHSGPVLSGALVDIYPIDKEEWDRIERYTQTLEKKIIDLVIEAALNLEPVSIYAANGTARFLVNRRNNPEQKIEYQSELKGPSDYSVPVLKVVKKSGDIKAIIFGHACHPVVLTGYQWAGDYPGFAQLELEKLYPGTTALFFQGAGADQNPMPRRTIPLARQHGITLAAAVDRVLHEKMKSLPSSLKTAYKEIDLPLVPISEKELAGIIQEKEGYPKQWALRMLEERRKGITPLNTYPYPIQIWNLGGLPLFSLGGELVVDYALNFKQKYGYESFVLGYSNDVMAYIPTVRILNEGGYEGADSQMVYGMPGLWSSEIETLIFKGVDELAEKVDIQRR